MGSTMTDLERIGEFGDVRRAERGAWLFDRIVATGLWCCAMSAATALVNAAAGQAPDFFSGQSCAFAGTTIRELNEIGLHFFRWGKRLINIRSVVNRLVRLPIISGGANQ
jgi:hypothetical protein